MDVRWLFFILLSLLVSACQTLRSTKNIVVTQKKGLHHSIFWDPSTLMRLSPLEGRKLNYAGYPRIRRMKDDQLVVVYEAAGSVEMIRSFDDGKKWSKPITIFNTIDRIIENEKTSIRMANPEIIELTNGEWLIACNYRPQFDGISPFAIAIRKSEDKGNSWNDIQVVYEAGDVFADGCWEPSFLQLPNGDVQLYFANEKPYNSSNEQEIAMLVSKNNGATWSQNPIQVSFRPEGRDGMPVALLLEKEIIVVIEDNKDGHFKPYIVRTSIKKPWKKTVIGDSSQRSPALADTLPSEVYAGAPYIIRLPSGQVLLSYQTTRGRTTDWEKSTMEVALGDEKGRNFKILSQPFEVPLDKEAKWNSLALWNDSTVVATSSSNLAGENIGVWMVLGRLK